jgi:dipeptidyl aminopeptidase/acylaminoacyl peptidase
MVLYRTIIGALSFVFSSSAIAQEAAKPATPEPLTIESFAAPPFMEGPQLSPNGEWIASRLSVEGKQVLAMTAVFDNKAKATMVGLDSEKIAVDGWHWVNDEWLLVYLSANDDVAGEKIRLSRVISIQRGTGKTIQLGWREAAQNAANVIWTAKDGTPRIYLGIQASVYLGELFYPEIKEFDVSTGKNKTVVKRRTPILDYYADATGNVRLGYGYDGEARRATLIYRAGDKGPFSVIERANLGKDEELDFPNMFLADASKALTIDDADGFDSVYEMELPSLTRGKKIFGLTGFDIDGLVSNADGNGLAGVSLTEDRPRVHWIDPGLAQTQADLDTAVGKGRANIVSWDRKRARLIVHVGGPDQAGAFYFYDRTSGGKMTLISYSDAKLKTRKLAPVSTIRYKARDGLDISAVLTLPQGRAAKSLPLILLPHGGPHARDYEQWDWINQYLAWRGYAVIQPNYRGSTGFGSKFLEAGEREWGLKMQDDLNDAVDRLVTQGIADPKRVCVLGGSYGGYAAMRAAQRDGGKFRCAISFAGVSDLAALARYDRSFLKGKEYGAHLKKQAPDYDSVSPLRHAAEFSAPILLIHGKADLRVPVKQSRDLAEKLKAGGKVYRYVEQPLADHHFSRQADRLQFLQEVDAWLRQYNPAD